MIAHETIEYVIGLLRAFLRKKLNGSITINFYEGTIKYDIKLHNDSAKKIFGEL